MPRGGIVPPSPVLAPGPALGSRPRVALSPPRLLQCTGDHGHRAMPGLGQPLARRSRRFRLDRCARILTEWKIVGTVRGSVHSVLSDHAIIYLLIGGLSATGLRSSEATDLSCHLSQVAFAPLPGAPSEVSRGTDRGDRSNLQYGQFGDRALAHDTLEVTGLSYPIGSVPDRP